MKRNPATGTGLLLGWAILATATTAPLAAQSDDAMAAVMAFDSLLQMPLSTVSKHVQAMREAPASTTVITAEEIELFGYSTLAEVLQNVRGFYLSYDRAYVTLGARGFSQPGGHNNQVLVLIDGHSINENFYDGARIGTALPIDLNAVDRIEIVRGPGSALYGSNAVFAVINIITKTRASLDGLIASGDLGSYARRSASITLGRELFSGLELLLSGTVAAAAGQDLYYAEYDAPATNNGIAEGLDWDNRYGVLGVLRRQGVSLFAMSTGREKGIPTGVYRGVFNSEAPTTDRRAFAELRVDHELSSSAALLVRGYYDDFDLAVTYPTIFAGVASANSDGRWLGGEGRIRWDIGAAFRFVVGVEYRQLQTSLNADAPGTVFWPSVVIVANPNWSVASGYAQGELQLTEHFALTLGGRLDHYSNTGSAFNPRGALVFHPGSATTFKFLYGEAFRAPNQWEQVFEVPGYFRLNPDLRPEQTRTMELVWEQRILPTLVGSASLYEYRVEGLVQWAIDFSSGQAFFDNVNRVEARGLEVGLNARLSSGLQASASYVWQRTEEQALAIDRPDSPRHQLRIGWAFRTPAGPSVAASLLYESRRQTLRGFPTESYVLGNISLSSGRLFDNLRLTLRIDNVLDSDIRHPAGPEHEQDVIQQDGRTFRVRADLTY